MRVYVRVHGTVTPPSTESNKPNPENPHVRENPIKDDEHKN